MGSGVGTASAADGRAAAVSDLAAVDLLEGGDAARLLDVAQHRGPGVVGGWYG